MLSVKSNFGERSRTPCSRTIWADSLPSPTWTRTRHSIDAFPRRPDRRRDPPDHSRGRHPLATTFRDSRADRTSACRFARSDAFGTGLADGAGPRGSLEPSDRDGDFAATRASVAGLACPKSRRPTFGDGQHYGPGRGLIGRLAVPTPRSFSQLFVVAGKLGASADSGNDAAGRGADGRRSDRCRTAPDPRRYPANR